MHRRLVELDLGLGDLCASTGLLRGQHRAIWVEIVSLLAIAAATAAWRPSTTFCSRSISRGATEGELRAFSSVLVASSSGWSAVGALRFAEALRIRHHKLCLRQLDRCVDLGELALGGLQGGLLLANCPA